MAVLAPKTASGGKIRARRFAPAWSVDKPLYRFGKIRHRAQARVGASILANTIGNLVADGIAGDGKPRFDSHRAESDLNSTMASLADQAKATSAQISAQARADNQAMMLELAGQGEPIVVIADRLLGHLLPKLSKENFNDKFVTNENKNLIHDTILAFKIFSDQQNAYFSSISHGYSISSYKPSALASIVQMAFPDAHSIGFGASADVALGAGVHLGGAYRYDLDTGAHGGTLDWGAGIGAAFSVGGGPFVSKESFNPKIPMSVDIGSNIGLELGPIAAETSYKWQSREGMAIVQNGEPWERTFSVAGYDLLGSRSALEEKYSGSYNTSNGNLNVEPSHAIPSISRDSFMAIGGKAYIFNLNVQNRFRF